MTYRRVHGRLFPLPPKEIPQRPQILIFEGEHAPAWVEFESNGEPLLRTFQIAKLARVTAQVEVQDWLERMSFERVQENPLG